MSTLGELRDTVASTLATAFAGSVREVATIDGAASLAELLRRSPRVPALLVDLPADEVASVVAGSPLTRITFHVYVVIAATANAARGKALLDLSGAVRQWIAATKPTWGDVTVTPPTGVARRNIYSAKLDSMSAALALVAWTQEARFTDTDPTLVDLAHLNFEWAVGDEGATITDDVTFP